MSEKSKYIKITNKKLNNQKYNKKNKRAVMKSNTK